MVNSENLRWNVYEEVNILDQRLAVLNDLYSFLQTQLEVKHSNKLEPWWL